MAGRIRSIKPELLEDERTSALTHEAFRLFVGLLLLADDHGNFRANPKMLEGAIFHTVGCSDSRGALETLASVSLVTLYRVRGQAYGHVRGWEKHQKVDRPSKPRMPGPADPEAVEVARLSSPMSSSREEPPRPSRDPRETLASDLRSPTPITDQEGEHARDPNPEPPPPTARSRQPEIPKPLPPLPLGIPEQHPNPTVATILAALLAAGPVLRPIATHRVAEYLAQRTCTDGHMGTVYPDDIAHGIRQFADSEGARLAAVGALPYMPDELSRRLHGFVRRVQRGEAKRQSEPRVDPDRYVDPGPKYPVVRALRPPPPEREPPKAFGTSREIA